MTPLARTDTGMIYELTTPSGKKLHNSLETAGQYGILQTSYGYSKDEYCQCMINGVKFTLFQEDELLKDSQNLDLKDSHLVVLSPLKVERQLTINTLSLICLADITPKTGSITLNLKDKCIKVGSKINAGHISITVPTFDIAITDNHLQQIRNKFSIGISFMDGEYILKGLEDVYKASIGVNTAFQMSDAFKFLGIPFIKA